MKKWMWYVIGALVLAGAAVGVIYGVVTHKEAGFMEVCWQRGQAVYTGCDATLELKWAKEAVPLPVHLELDAHAEKNYKESIVKGFELWNKEVGPVFKFVDKKADARVFVTWGSQQPGSHAGGHTRHEGGEAGPDKAYVEISEPSDVHAVYRYAAHEAGHVLGLGHDEAPRSIMYPVQPGMTEEMTFVLPSDHDKKLLKETYIK
jgi:hypothetical protein